MNFDAPGAVLPESHFHETCIVQVQCLERQARMPALIHLLKVHPVEMVTASDGKKSSFTFSNSASIMRCPLETEEMSADLVRT